MHVPSSSTDHPLIALTNLQKVYQMGTQQVKALAGVSLNIFPNEYVAIMGPSGSGKSTLMNIVGCLDVPTAGRYTLNRQRVEDMTEHELADVRNREIGFIFQTFNLLPRITCLQNVALPLVYAGYKKRARTAQAMRTLEQVGLQDRLYHKPNELSGGQRQRVAVARALVTRPSLLLADEPTGNLDTATSDEIMRLFEVLYRAGHTLLVVTHEEEIAQHARRVVRLRDGRIASDVAIRQPRLADQQIPD